MTWSTQHVDSLPSGVRALPRGLRSAWVGAASAARAAGLSASDARQTGDGVVEVITRGLAEIGLAPTALESWNDAASSSHPLVKLLQHDGLEGACASLVTKDGPALGPADDQDAAPWLLDQLGRRLTATDGGPSSEGIDDAPGPDPAAEQLNDDAEQPTLLDCFRKRFTATVAAGALAASTVLGGYADAAGRVWRTDSLPLSLDDASTAAVDRAIKRAEEQPSKGLKAAIDQLRADGFDDYITPEGYLRIRAKAARDGVQLYSNGVDVWGELRPEEAVFDDVSIKSWDYKPFTNDHPDEFVGIDNWGRYVVGVVGNARKAIGTDGRSYVEVDIVVADLDTLIAIREGKVELSAGYTAGIRREAGRDRHGDEYRYRQFDIYINHLSLVDRGRAGPIARITVDGYAWQVAAFADAVGTHTDQHEDNMTTDKIKVQLTDDGIEVEMTKDQAEKYKAAKQKAIDDAVAAAKQTAAAEVADANKPHLDAFKSQLDAMQGQLESLTKAKAEQDAALLVLQTENARLKADADARERSKVFDTIKGVCPKLDLAKIVGRKNDKGEQLEPTLADFKAAAVRDLAPHYGDALDSYPADGFETFVDKLFDAEVGKVTNAPTSTHINDARPGGSAPARVVDLNALRDEFRGKAS